MFSLMYIIGLICIGLLAGFASGLLGVGGGFIIVPLQFFLLTSSGVSGDLAMMLSLGTSLAVIIPTALSGAFKHHKENKNIIKPGITLGLFGIIGGFFGGILASFIPSNLLQLFFGIFLFLIAIDMFRTISNSDSKSKIQFTPVSAGIIGLATGILSGLLGIGGGVLLIPILSSVLGFVMIEAIGISSVFISLTAIGGVLSYIYSGLNINTIPYSLGYVNLVNFGVIVLFSVPLAYLGAKLAYKVPEKSLKKVFAIVLIYMAIKMIGFDPIMYLVGLF